jgi:hypothetical protein
METNLETGVAGGDDAAIAAALRKNREAAQQSEKKPEKPAPSADPEMGKPQAQAEPADEEATPAGDYAPPAETEEPTSEDPEKDNPQDEHEEEPKTVEIGPDDYNKVATVKINGKEHKVKLGEALSGYMRDADYRQKTQELGEVRRSFHQEAEQFTQLRQNTLAELGVLANELVTHLTNDRTDWNALRQNDPAEYAARLADVQEKRQLLQRTLSARKQVEEHIAAYQQRQIEEQKAEEAKRLLMKLPAWSDPKFAESEKQGLRAFLSAEGYSPEEISGLVDHRAVIVARKAMLYDKLMADREKALKDKRLKDAPPMAKPGAQSNRDTGKAQLDATLNRLRKSGSVEDAAKALSLRRRQYAR